jgi:hypothetical protein
MNVCHPGPAQAQDRVQLDSVRCYAALAMALVETADADNVHPDPGARPEGPGVEARGKGAAHSSDGRRLCGKAALWPVEQQIRA